jgi:hypothetical protein
MHWRARIPGHYRSKSDLLSPESCGRHGTVRLSLDPDWREFLCVLIDRRVRFLIVGGLAVAAHAEPRFTKDLDILVDATLANGRRLRAALVDFGFGADAPAPEELARPGPGWLLGRVPKRIDILTEIAGVTFRRAWANRVHAKLDEKRHVPIIGRHELLAAKLAAGRPQDLADAAAIELFMADEERPRGRKKRKG